MIWKQNYYGSTDASKERHQMVEASAGVKMAVFTVLRIYCHVPSEPVIFSCLLLLSAPLCAPPAIVPDGRKDWKDAGGIEKN
jgi:hypothetical protein